jgi:hypothetical protein
MYSMDGRPYDESFAHGLDLAAELIDRTGVRDPEMLRRAAEHVERLTSGPVAAGYARGLRIAAHELEDARSL